MVGAHRLPAALSSVLLIGLMAVAATAQPCPSKMCYAKYDKLQGGPVDCCNHDYSKGKCYVGNTPVSWRKVGSCTSGGATYAVLTEDNFQGPPQTEQCRCDNAMGAAATKPVQNLSPMQACITLTPRYDVDIQGADAQCDGQSYCKVCGGVDAIKNACLGKPRCIAFTYEQASGCGYLKTSADGRTTRSGWVSFTRA